MYGIIFSIDDEFEISNSDKDVWDLTNDDLPKFLKKFGFEQIHRENSHYYKFYLYRGDDMVAVVKAMTALKELEWFKESVTDIQAFKIEQWSDFTPFFKE